MPRQYRLRRSSSRYRRSSSRRYGVRHHQKRHGNTKYYPHRSKGSWRPTYARRPSAARTIVKTFPQAGLSAPPTGTRQVWTVRGGGFQEVFHINNIPLGTGTHERSSSGIYMRNLRFLVNWYNNSGVFSSNTHFDHGWLLVYDRKPHPAGTPPTLSDVMTEDHIDDIQRDDTRDRFEILWSFRKQTIAHPIWDSNNNQVVYMTEHPRMQDIVIPIRRIAKYRSDAATGTPADFERGALYMMAMSTSGTGAVEQAVVHLQVSYTDML